MDKLASTQIPVQPDDSAKQQVKPLVVLSGSFASTVSASDISDSEKQTNIGGDALKNVDQSAPIITPETFPATIDRSDGFGLVSKVKGFLYKSVHNSPTTSPQSSPKAQRKISNISLPCPDLLTAAAAAAAKRSTAASTVQHQEDGGSLVSAASSVGTPASNAPPSLATDLRQSGGVLVADRKMSGKFNSFFYRPTPEEVELPVATVVDTAIVSNPVAPQMSATAAHDAAQQSQLVMAAASASGMTASQARKNRKPKPSQLREMNFWAPNTF